MDERTLKNAMVWAIENMAHFERMRSDAVTACGGAAKYVDLIVDRRATPEVKEAGFAAAMHGYLQGLANSIDGLLPHLSSMPVTQTQTRTTQEQTQKNGNGVYRAIEIDDDDVPPAGIN